jgi:hypothetical protein
LARSGRYFSAGSSRPTRPCSTSCISATEVIGFVIDAIRKIESVESGLVVFRSATPNAP